MTRTRAFWATLAFLSLAGSLFALRLFPVAFPILSVEIAISRTEALDQARGLAQEEDWDLDDHRQAASFTHLDRAFQTYMELEGGGLERLNQLVRARAFPLYAWRIRHFTPGEIRELDIRFTPQGELYGFRLTLPENAPGPGLSPDAARNLAGEEASDHWQIPLERYQLLESSLEEMPGGRVDHTFVFQDSTLALGEARLRLRLTVSGDRLTEVSPFFHVPESFERRYQDTRNANESISLAGTVIFLLLFLGIGGGVGATHLLKRGKYEWKAPLAWGALVAGLMALGALNSLPLAWMGYDTALPPEVYTGTQIISAALTFLAGAALLGLLFMVGEGLMRLGFPDQIQLWRMGSPQVASSDSAMGRALAPYLIVGIEMGFVVAFYLVTSRWAGWWSPASALAEPDLLATHFPWLTAVSTSLFAAFSEETIFRAIPIGAAAFWGRRQGRPGLWIWGAVVLQALVFGASHANYPQQPPYARVVEIFPLYLIWGIVCVYFGLVPAIVGHFLYDLVLFSIPLFAANTPGIWIDRAMVVAAGSLPLLVVLTARARYGARSRPPEEALNRSWRPPGESSAGRKPSRQAAHATSRAPEPLDLSPVHSPARHDEKVWPARAWILVGLMALAALGVWGRSLPSGGAPGLKLGRVEAETAARDGLAATGITLGENWVPQYSVTDAQGLAHHFVWRSGGPEAYRAVLGDFLAEPRWRIRFVNFQAPPEEQAESFSVRLSTDGTPRRITHLLPEGRPGASLEEGIARALALTTLRRRFGLSQDQVREVSAEETVHPNRTDWTFTYSTLQGFPLDTGEGRVQVEIAGTEVVDAGKFVYVPEEWERDWRAEEGRRALANLVPAGLLLLAGLGGLIWGVVLWVRGSLGVGPLKILTVGVGSCLVLTAANGWPATLSSFTTDLSYTNQTVIALVGMVVGAALVGLAAGLAASLGHTWLAPKGPSLKGGVWVGGALGLMLVAGMETVSGWLTDAPPAWPDYSGAVTYSPVVSAALAPILGFLILTAGAFLILGTLERAWGTRLMLASGVLLLLLGLAVAPNPAGGSWAGWVVAAMVVATVLALFWRLARRWGWRIVPWVVAAVTLTGGAETLIAAPFPGAVFGTGIGIAGVLVLAHLWSRVM